MDGVERLKISVIMLTYNRESLVERAIKSIQRQTLQDYEFIIIDNGSTDASGAIAERCARNDPRIRVIHRERGNIGSGRNAGLNLSKGDYITFIDDDDYAEPDFLEFLYRLSQEYQADIAVCGSNKSEGQHVFPNGNYAYDQLYLLDAQDATVNFLFRKLYNAAMPTKLVRRELFEYIRFPAAGNYDDITTTYRYFANANRVVAHGIPKYTFYRHPGNNSSAATKHYLLHSAQLYEYLAAFRERTTYISEVLPQLTDLALYSEWSYMISMVEKIHRFHLQNCTQPLEWMLQELKMHQDEFYYGEFTQEFEKKWMMQYVVSSKMDKEVI